MAMGGMIRSAASAARAHNARGESSGLINTDISDKEAEREGARVTREQAEHYLSTFAPAEERLAATLGEATAQRAAGGSTQDAQRARSALERMRSRYGVGLTAGQRQAEDGQTQRQTTLGALSAQNTARQADEDRDFNLRGTLLNIGNNVSSSAMGGLTDSAVNANARNQAHQQAQAQHQQQRQQQRAATMQSVVSLGALALM